MKYYVAIDIGASSGRHIVGWKEKGELCTKEVYRFPNGVDEVNGTLTWDVGRLFREIVAGLKEAFSQFKEIESVAIDTWGVDYVLLDKDGKEILPCHAYRDDRTKGSIEEVHKIIPFEELYAHTGIQFQPFNTIYQLYDDLKKGRLEKAEKFLMLPEYLSYKLTGVARKEYTEASTSGLLDAKTGQYDMEIVRRLGLPERLFEKLDMPGTEVGALKAEIAAEVGGQTTVILCASHDTASAVEGIPEDSVDMPYLSSGTWSLFGVRLKQPILSDKSCKANYTNEGGVGYIRYLKNIMGLWLVQSLRKELCPEKSFGDIAQEAQNRTYSETVDADDWRFLAPESMKGAFDEYLREAGKPLPEAPIDYFRCAFMSLANSYAKAMRELEKITGEKYEGLCIVGGGAKNQFLNDLTERACGVRVHAIPIEATAFGNLKIQMKRGEK